MVNQEVVQGPKLPYVSWRSFWTFIEDLRVSEHAPQVIDNSIWGPNRSGALRSQLGIALRFLGLLEGERTSTPAFHKLVEDPDPVLVLKTLIEERFAPVIALGLENATLKQVDETLAQMGAGQGDTLRKSRVFFINAAEHAGLPLGPYLKKSATASKSGAPRKKTAKRAAGQTPAKPIVPAGDEFSLDLRSAGQVRVVITAPLWELDEHDLEFVLAVRKMVLGYTKTAGSTAKSTDAADEGSA